MASIRPNARYYNNPQLGQGFENLAQMFAPADPVDAANDALAAQRRQEAEMRAAIWNKIAPSGDTDKLSVLADIYDPDHSYFAVNEGNRVTERGQDVSAATSRANNAADNARALREAADKNKLGLVTSAFGPLNVGQVRPAIPADIAGWFDLPALPAETGAMNVGQGDTTYLPNGQVVHGAPKPLSETEMMAVILGRQPEAVQDAKLLSDIPVEQVAGPAGPTIVRRSDAVGKQPFINKGAEAKPETQNWIGPGGKGGGTAIFDSAINDWKDTATGQRLPAGSRTYTGQLTGDAAGTGFAPTVANQTNANNQEAEITRAADMLDIYQGLVTNNPASVGLAGAIRGTAQDIIASSQDLAASFGKTAPQLANAALALQDGMKGVAPELFDQSVDKIKFMQGAIAYGLARTENPSGEVSRQAYQSALSRVQGGKWISSSKSTLAAIAAQRAVLQTQLDALKVLRSPGTGRTDTNYQAGGGADYPTLTQEQYEAAPSGTKFTAPDGSQRVKP